MRPRGARPRRSAGPFAAAAIAVPLLLAQRALAAAPAIDADLLEFLGSVDSEEPGWHDFLARNDVKTAGKPRSVTPPVPAAPPPAPIPPARKVKDT